MRRRYSGRGTTVGMLLALAGAFGALLAACDGPEEELIVEIGAVPTPTPGFVVDPIGTSNPGAETAEPMPANSPLPSWTIPPCDRLAATIRAGDGPAAARPTTVAVDTWKAESGICLRVENVVLQPLGVDLVLVNLTLANGSSADIVYGEAEFSVVNADGGRFPALVQTPPPEFRTLHAFETKWEQLTFQIVKGVPLRELVWRPEGLHEIRVELAGDVPITAE